MRLFRRLPPPSFRIDRKHATLHLPPRFFRNPWNPPPNRGAHDRFRLSGKTVAESVLPPRDETAAAPQTNRPQAPYCTDSTAHVHHRIDRDGGKGTAVGLGIRNGCAASSLKIRIGSIGLRPECFRLLEPSECLCENDGPSAPLYEHTRSGPADFLYVVLHFTHPFPTFFRTLRSPELREASRPCGPGRLGPAVGLTGIRHQSLSLRSYQSNDTAYNVHVRFRTQKSTF